MQDNTSKEVISRSAKALRFMLEGGISWLTESSSTMASPSQGSTDDNMQLPVAAPAPEGDDDSVMGTAASGSTWVEIGSTASAGGMNREERTVRPQEKYHLPLPWPPTSTSALTWTKTSSPPGASVASKRGSSPGSSSARPPRGSVSPRSKDSKSERHYKTLQLVAEKNRNLKNQLQTAVAQVTHVASLNRENAEESQVHG